MKIAGTYIIAILLSASVIFSGNGISYLKDTCEPCHHENISVIWMFNMDEKQMADDCSQDDEGNCCGETENCCSSQKNDSVQNHSCCNQYNSDKEEHKHKLEFLCLKIDIKTTIDDYNDDKELYANSISYSILPDNCIALKNNIKQGLFYHPKIPLIIESGREILRLKSSLTI